MKLVLKAYKEPQYVKRTKREQCNSIALVLFGYNHIQNDIYMDEGIIHRTVTLAVNYGLSDHDFFTLIGIFGPVIKQIKCFYLEISLQDAFRAIRKRNRHECEMDEFDDDELIQYLKAYEHYFRLVHNHFNHNIVTRNNYEIMR